MLISLVTGTYNRLEHLQGMIASFRADIPRHIPYEIIIVDGGSTDGTPEWCEAQPDIRFIQHGSLKGAIKAFCDGARAASGEYVLMANDDITFAPYSVIRALSYLEDKPVCGGVAFADTRASQMGHGEGYQVLGMPAVNPDRSRGWVKYAQVGLFRRWLGNEIGWWGDLDPVMGRAKTYGGDNWLSAHVWQRGYTVDAVEGCQIEDKIVRDILRQSNVVDAPVHPDSAAYYEAFPHGPQLPAVLSSRDDNHRLRIMVLPIYEIRYPGRKNKEYGLSEALAKTGLTYEIDYINEPRDVIAAVRAWQPHLLITQLHDTNHINAGRMAAIRAECPSMVVVNWNGDAHERGLISPDMLALLKQIDLQTVVNTRVMPIYDHEGIRAAYWQIAYKDPVEPYNGQAPKWDILFLGNCYNDERYALVSRLRELPLKVGIYGHCPDPQGNTHYDFAFSRALYENCKIAISDTYPDTEGFVSNRLFQALSAGAFVLQQHSEKLDALTGLRAGFHYIEWRDLDDLARLCREYGKDRASGKRKGIARAGMDFVRNEFSHDAQVRKLFKILGGLR